MNKLNHRVAIYPGTFDPITRGHEDLVRRAATLFDKLILAIAESPSKRPYFTLEERVDMAKEILADMKNVEIVGFNTLLMDFVHERGANVIVRGLRAVADFEYEFQMTAMNQRLNSDIETVFLMADPRHQAIASRLVKEIARLDGAIDSFVSPAVAERVRAKVKGLG